MFTGSVVLLLVSIYLNLIIHIPVADIFKFTFSFASVLRRAFSDLVGYAISDT
jgi:hypothetical protein